MKKIIFIIILMLILLLVFSIAQDQQISKQKKISIISANHDIIDICCDDVLSKNYILIMDRCEHSERHDFKEINNDGCYRFVYSRYNIIENEKAYDNCTAEYDKLKCNDINIAILLK